ncbi:MAG: M23 family metallopeptidase [Acidimicrobiia bacterium]|nr:M23 family metallopeptidase [Acidimicrobiia bacterium]
MGRTRYAVAVATVLFVGATVIGVVATPHAGAQDPSNPSSTLTTTTSSLSTSPSEPEPSEPEPSESEMPESEPDDTTPRPPNPVERIDVTKKLVFPVVGSSYFYAGFGGCRDNCTREHHGIDIMTRDWRGLPVVAAQDGTVTRVTYDEGNAGCSVHIRHRDRWETRYLHLSNDIPGSDDIGFPCPLAGIEPGVRVKAGQIIAYVGDSGNAETTPPHLHFELRMPNGHPVDPYKSLKKADRIVFEWLPTDFSTASLAITQNYDPDPSTTTVVLLADEAAKLTSSEVEELRLDAPVIAVNHADPAPAIAEIDRIGSRAIIIMSDSDTRWIHDLLVGHAPIIESVPLPTAAHSDDASQDEFSLEVLNPSPVDSFATIVAGRIDKIWRSRTEAFETFAAEHRSLVLVSDSYGSRNLGSRSGTSPSSAADRNLYWWATGDGWIGTDSMFKVPDRGYAYLTERRATPWTLTFLGSLTEADPMPIWRTD